MKWHKKSITFFLLIPFLWGCGGITPNDSLTDTSTPSSAPVQTKLSFKDYSDANDKMYNTDLFYRNDLKIDMGDPMIVYDEESQYFYSSGTRGTTSFHCFRSKNLSDWEKMDDLFVPEATSWSKKDLWAPDIQKINGKWYLYYTAAFEYTDASYNKTSNCQIGVAVSDTPYGPYKQVVGPDGTLKTTPFAFKENDQQYATILDQHVFEDDDGQLYMYFSYDLNRPRSQDYQGLDVAEIWGVKMKSPTEWDLSTLTRLISPGYKTLNDEQRTIDWETWSPSFQGEMECTEGPYMIKKNGKYILTYTANSFVDTVYNVGYAVSSSPLGEFVKPDDYPLQNMLLGVPGAEGTYINTRYLGFMTGTGHASIFQIGDEYMFAYHAHQNRKKWGEDNNEYRALGIDYLYFDQEGNPYTNGPTWSLNHLPSALTGYRNLCLDDGIVISGDGENLNYLIDAFTNRAYNTEEVRKEADFTGKSTIRIRLNGKKKVKFLQIANSYNVNKKIDYINEINFGDNRVVKDVLFNQSYITKTPSFIFPHSCFIVELEEEIETDEITITIDGYENYSLGEIEIYGGEIG